MVGVGGPAYIKNQIPQLFICDPKPCVWLKVHAHLTVRKEPLEIEGLKMTEWGNELLLSYCVPMKISTAIISISIQVVWGPGRQMYVLLEARVELHFFLWMYSVYFAAKVKK